MTEKTSLTVNSFIFPFEMTISQKDSESWMFIENDSIACHCPWLDNIWNDIATIANYRIVIIS